MKENNDWIFSKDDRDRVFDGSRWGSPKRYSSIKDKKYIYNHKQFEEGRKPIEGELEKTEVEKKIIHLAEKMIRNFMNKKGFYGNLREMDIDRVHVIEGGSEKGGYYDTINDSVALSKLQESEREGDKKFKVDFLIRSLHELIHRYQLHEFFVISKLKERKLYPVASQVSLGNPENKKEYKRDLFRGVMEQYTQVLVVEIIKENRESIEEETGVEVDWVVKEAQNNWYYNTYRHIMRKIESMLINKFNIENTEEYLKNIYNISINGEVNKKYLKAIKDCYGKNALRVLSYMGSEFILEEGQKKEIEMLKLINEYFEENVGIARREKIEKDLTRYRGRS